jgi:transcriptional regulator with XRE-family HTH domain
MIDSTAISRELGAKLRESREKAGLRSAEVARGLGWPQSKVSRLETGDRTADPLDLAMYLGHCKLSQDEARPILALAKEPDTGIWPRPHNKQLPDRLLSLIMSEAPASTICCYEPVFVPGLLQTREYAAEIIRGLIKVEPDQVQAQVDARRARQEMLKRVNPPQALFFIEELALRNPVGGPLVMNEQLLHLMFSATRPQISIRVVPMTVGVHAASGSQFSMMHYHDRQPVIWLEGTAISTLVEQRGVVEMYRAVRSELHRIALDEEQSRSMLAGLASVYDLDAKERGADERPDQMA